MINEEKKEIGEEKEEEKESLVKQKLYDDMKNAMKIAIREKDTTEIDIIRLVKKNIQELETSPGRTHKITDDEVQDIIRKMVKQSNDAIEQFDDAGRQDLSEKEKKQIEVLKRYLPKQLSDEEIAKEIDSVIKETGLREIGPLMKILKEKMDGVADGKTIATILKKKIIIIQPKTDDTHKE